MFFNKPINSKKKSKILNINDFIKGGIKRLISKNKGNSPPHSLEPSQQYIWVLNLQTF